ncbi:MAG TPA: serine hydrolase domain-containing protein, partial [Rhizomicrobium sp.]
MRMLFRTACLCVALAAAPIAPASASADATPPALTSADVDTLFGGLVPFLLEHFDIAGAQIAVVKDGRPLFEKGYGYSDVAAKRNVDPRTTLFRPGSVSKLFVWTAVMQLVEQGRIGLDTDVNTYLDFRIPPTWPRPVTMRDLMTHTAGFEEVSKDLFVEEKAVLPLGAFLRERIPRRLYPPGTIPAYSNYGAALAGYIVQRVSGEPLNAYIARHVFAPLGMEYATFDQPVPPRLARLVSKGYVRASQDPVPYETINMHPAGSAAVSTGDMARFMIAHLDGGAYGTARILKAETAALMHRTAHTPVPGLPGMALGFVGEMRNGRTLLAHGGDTVAFHSALHLILNERTGLYISFNSAGKDGGSDVARNAIFAAFMDRYFPRLPFAPHKAAGSKTDASLVAGSYVLSRGSFTNLMAITNLFGREDEVTANPDGSIVTPVLTSIDQTPRVWRPAGPFLWKLDDGERLYGAKLVDGKVAYLGEDDLAPIEVQLPTPLSLAAWNLPLFFCITAMFALVVLFWPVKALLRWRYERPLALTGRARL